MRRFCCCLLDEEGRADGDEERTPGALLLDGREGDLRAESGVRSAELSAEREADEVREPKRWRARPGRSAFVEEADASLSRDCVRGRARLLLPLPPPPAAALALASLRFSLRFSLSSCMRSAMRFAFSASSRFFSLIATLRRLMWSYMHSNCGCWSNNLELPGGLEHGELPPPASPDVDAADSRWCCCSRLPSSHSLSSLGGRLRAATDSGCEPNVPERSRVSLESKLSLRRAVRESSSTSSSLPLDRRLAAFGLCDAPDVAAALVALRCDSDDLDECCCCCVAAFSRLPLDLLACGGAGVFDFGL